MRGLFVTGTDTEAGKTVVAAAIVAALAASGHRVAAYKPVVTGLADAAGEWPRDHELLASVATAGQSPAEVAPLAFDPPLSPHLAAELAGVAIDPAQLVAGARRAARGADLLVAEGVGGALVPFTTGFSVADLIAALGMPAVVAARPGLGTINHTRLTVEALRARGVRVAGVVMTPWPQRTEAIERSNRDTVGALCDVAVAVLGPTRPDAGALAAAGAGLPIAGWLRGEAA